MRTMGLDAVLLVVALGCARNTPAAGETAGHHGHHGHHGHGGGEGHGHPAHSAFPAEVAAFHDVLRPVWHSEPGAGRDARACTEAATLRTRAAAVGAAAAPANARDAAAWSTRTGQLTAAAEALVQGCGATPRGDVAGQLEALHTAFHALVEQLEGPPHAH